MVSFPFDAHFALGLFLAFIRASAWLVVTPPFSNRTIPAPAKVALAGGLALAVADKVGAGPVPADTAGLVGAAVEQAFTGLALGFIVNVLLSAAQSAGNLIGLFGGFSLPTAIDPLSQGESNVVGQVYGLLAVTLLFALDAHLLLIKGFLSSFGTEGLSLHSTGALMATLTHDLAVFFTASLEIAAPLLAVLFLAQVVLGILAKAAPQLNVFVLGLPFQVLLTLTMVGLGVRVLPAYILRLVGQAASDGVHLLTGVL